MKSVEFQSEVGPGGAIQLPPEIVEAIPAGERLHISVGWGFITDEDEAAWRALGQKAFEAAYAPEDSIYEQLLDDTPAR